MGIRLILALLLCSTAHAEEFTFKYKLDGETLEVHKKAKDWKEAYELAAQVCYDHYIHQRTLTHDYGLDVIDLCANPR